MPVFGDRIYDVDGVRAQMLVGAGVFKTSSVAYPA